MNPQSIPSRSIKLILPSARGLAIENFQTKVEHISKRARLDAELSGSSTPVIILFSEICLKYIFSITPDEIHRSIDKMQKKLPPDLEMVVGFSALEKTAQFPSNIGHIFTSGWRGTSIKRSCTSFDKNHLSTIGQDHKVFLWGSRGKRMEARGAEFAHFELKNSMRVELRVCVDVKAEPIVSEPNTITIVPACNIDPRDADSLSDNRRSVVINDGGEDWHGECLVTNSKTLYRSTHKLTHEIEV